MNILPDNEEGLQKALEVLQAGGVVAHATETCYGLACDMSNAAAVEKVFAIKQRPSQQPISALCASIDQAKRYTDWNEKADELAKKHLPGPLTVILPLRGELYPCPDPNPNPTIGIRVSSHPIAQKLVDMFGSPISTTSANVHSMPNPYSVADMQTQFAEGTTVPDLLLDSGVLPQVPPSSVVDASKENVETYRQGDIDAQASG